MSYEFARMAAVGLVLTAGAVPGVSRAQFAPSLDDQSTVVEELVIRGYGGPPWWKVEDGDSTVFILVDPGPLPAGVRVDTSMLEKRMKGATRLILTPRGPERPGAPPASGAKLMKAMNKQAKVGVEATLPEATRRRFVALRERSGLPEQRYGALPPGLAGAALAGDIAQLQMQAGRPEEQGASFERLVWTAAKSAKVPAIQPARIYKPKDLNTLYDDVWRLDAGCLNSILPTLETPASPPTRSEPVLRAWADGDVKPLLAAVRASGRNPNLGINRTTSDGSYYIRITTAECRAQMPTLKRLGDDWAPSQVTAITEALSKPGHAVALLDAPSLVSSGGVLDQLRRKGFKVTGPDGADGMG